MSKKKTVVRVPYTAIQNLAPNWTIGPIKGYYDSPQDYFEMRWSARLVVPDGFFQSSNFFIEFDEETQAVEFLLRHG